MSKIAVNELFPTKLSGIIFITYILLFVGQGILVTASQQSNKYDYNIVLVVMTTEALKLVISTLLYCRNNTVHSLMHCLVSNKKVCGLYFIPALLYCFYNNLAFVNLAQFDPTTYYLLLQLRVVVTGVLFQVIFKKKLSGMQWLSLCILTCGCMLKQVNFTNDSVVLQKSTSVVSLLSAVLILVQIVCSCLAGVYNEYLLKKDGAKVNIFMQNIFMYLNSIICNIFLLVLQEDALSVFTYSSWIKLLDYKVLLVMCNNAAIGIVTSFFLKTLNSILKTFASALELILTAIFSYFLFSIPIYLNTMLSICTVMFAVYLYSQNPISNQHSDQYSQESTERRELIKTEEV